MSSENPTPKKVTPIEAGQKIRIQKQLESINKGSEERTALFIKAANGLEEMEEALSREMSKPPEEIDHALTGVYRDDISMLNATMNEMVVRNARAIDEESQLREKIRVIEEHISKKKY